MFLVCWSFLAVRGEKLSNVPEKKKEKKKERKKKKSLVDIKINKIFFSGSYLRLKKATNCHLKQPGRTGEH